MLRDRGKCLTKVEERAGSGREIWLRRRSGGPYCLLLSSRLIGKVKEARGEQAKSKR
jgi:hypothetical protein